MKEQPLPTSPFQTRTRGCKPPSTYMPPKKYEMIERCISKVQDEMTSLEKKSSMKKGTEEDLLTFHRDINTGASSISLSLSSSRSEISFLDVCLKDQNCLVADGDFSKAHFHGPKIRRAEHQRVQPRPLCPSFYQPMLLKLLLMLQLLITTSRIHFTLWIQNMTSISPFHPVPDQMPARSPQNMQDQSQSSSNTRGSPAVTHSTPALSSSVSLFHSLNIRRSSPRRQNEADFSGSFLPLHPECTLNEPNLSRHEDPPCGDSCQEQDQETPFQHGVLQSFDAASHDASHRPFTGRHSSTILTSAAEDSGSFHALVAAQTTVNDSELSEHPISDILERNSNKSVHFEELPAGREDVNTDHDVPQDPEEGASQVPSQPSDQTPRSENMSLTSHSRSSLQSLSSLTIGSSAGSLQSFIHTWDSESMRGILEEPDLTLLSLNDSSIVFSEPPLTQTADHQGGNTSQSTFHPLHPEVDSSGFHVPDQSSAEGSLSQHLTEMSLEFTSTPGSLQEAFLRKKRHLIENSSKRVQDIMKKDRVPKQKPQTSDLSDVSVIQGEQRSSSDPVPSDGGQMKKVVEVRVSTPEDRKLTEIEMHQRTIRLYNRLHEVKTRREDKMRQETYAKNREKAKDFKKRTLEKLRAKR